MNEMKYCRVRKILIAVLFCFLIVFILSIFSCISVSAENIEEPFKLTVLGGDKKYVYIDCKIKAPDHMVEEDIFNRRINAPLKQKTEFVDSLIKRGLTIKNSLCVAFPKLGNFASEIKESTDRAPINSEVVFAPNQKEIFSYTREEDGVVCDERRLYQDIYLALKEQSRQPIYLIKRTVAPTSTRKSNADITRLVASFSTTFSSSKPERQHNILTALGKLNGAIVNPNETISFNKTVGERSEKNGFKNAKIIVDGKYVDGIGGGVCQVSTALYNAAIRGGMEAVEVHNHSLAPSYVPPSLDAMVSGVYADLVLKNVSNQPIFIRATSFDGVAKVELYSGKLTYKIVPVSRIIFTGEPPSDDEFIDIDNLYVSPLTPPKTRVRVSYGVPEIKSEAYAVYFDDKNNEVGKKFLRKDSYKCYPGIVAVAPEQEVGKGE